MMKDLNLLPLELLNGRQAKKRTRIMILYMILFLVICLVGAESLVIDKINYEKKKVSYQSQINSLKDVENLDNTLGEKKQRLNRYQEVLNSSGNLPDTYRGIFDKLESNTPKNVFILEMNVSGDKISAKCVASSKTEVADFDRRLKDSNSFHDVFISDITGSNESTDKSNGNLSFSLSCTINIQKGSTK